MKENKTQRVLTSLLMGMNCVNGLAPLATLSDIDVPKPITPVKTQDEQIEYTPANFQGLVDSVDRAVFGTAEAFTEVLGPAPATTNFESYKTVGPGLGDAGGSVQIISSGATTYGNKVIVGGTVTLSSGGKASMMTNDGGLVLNSGGTTSAVDQNNSITNHGKEYLYDGASSYRVVMRNGAEFYVSGAAASVGAIFAGASSNEGNGCIIEINGGTVYQAHLYGDASCTIHGGYVNNISGFYDATLDMDGGTGNNMWIQSGASAYIKGGTVLYGRVTEESYTEVTDSGIYNQLNVYGGSAVFSSGGQGFDAIVYSDGRATIGDGGTMSKTLLYDSATVEVNAGGSAIATTIGGKHNTYAPNSGAGAVQIVNTGGVASKTYISGGAQKVNGGSAYYTSIYNSNGEQIISGGTGISTIIYYGTQTISGGTASDTQNYALQIVSGGTALNNTGFNSMTTQTVVGGTAINNIMASGLQEVKGGTAISNNFYNGVQKVSGGSAVSNTFSKGANQTIDGSGYVVSNFLNSGSLQTVLGGSTEFTNISSGASQLVKGGTAKVNNISAGGTQTVSGGTVTSNNIAGAQIVLLGQAVSNTISAGATQNISGGTASDNIINAGGVQNISAGGTAIENNDQNLAGTVNVGSGAVEIVNGKQDIAAGAAVTVAAGGTQVVNGEVSPGLGTLTVGGTQLINTGGTATNPTLTSGAEQIVQGGTAFKTEIVGGATQTILSGSAQHTIVDSNGVQVINGGTAINTKIFSGGVQKGYSGTLGGGIISGGITEIYSPSMVIDDVTMTDGIIRFGADGGNYNITGVFDFQGGTVDMVSNPDGHNPNPRTYETLTIADLQGNDGTFKMDIDLDSAVAGSETTYGDKIVITDGTPGTHYIQVADKSLYTGTEITGDRKLLLVTDLSGVTNLNYVGKDLNNGGVWHTLPPLLFKEGNKWYLGYIMKEPSNDTTTYITDRQVAVYNQWTRIANDSLRKRLGDLRYNDAEDGVWARFYRGKLSGDNFNQSYNTYQVGIDKTNGESTYGLAVEKQETSQSYGYGNGEGTMVAANIYYTKYTDTGSYFDAIYKYGKLNSKYDTTGDFPDHADYDTKAYSLSLEYGKTNKYKNGYFFEPKIQLTYGNIGAEDYVTDRGTLMEESSIKSLIGKLGFVAGRKLNDTSDYYFKAGIFREFRGERDVHLAAANGENMYRSEDYSDTWFEIGLGGNVKVAKKTHVYGDIEKSIGADIQKDWQFNVGVRWEF